MVITQTSALLQKALTDNSTDAAYPSIPPTTTAPTAITLANVAGNPVPENILVMPYVLGANNATFSVRVTGWSLIGTLWVPTVLGAYDCVAGNVSGVAGAAVLDTERFADTVTLTANMGTDGQGTTKVSPQDDTPGHFIIKTRGSQLIQFQFTKGTGTSANALYRAF